MNTEIILNMIERRKQHFISWQMDHGFKEAYKKVLSEQCCTEKHFLATILLVLSYTTLGFCFASYFLEGNRFSSFLIIAFIIAASLSTIFFMDYRFNKKANRKMEELIETDELRSICEEKYSDIFYSEYLDITLKNSLKLHMSQQEWDALRLYTHDNITFGTLKDFLNYHKEMSMNNPPIEHDKLIIEATALYSGVR